MSDPWLNKVICDDNGINMNFPHPPDTPIERSDFEPGRLKLGGYRVQHVGAAMVDHLLGRPLGQLTPRQKEGLQKWQQQSSWSLTSPENYEDLRKFFDIFDKVFFNGLLKGHCRLEIYSGDRGFPEAGGYCQLEESIGSPGEERDPRFLVKDRVALIAIRRNNIPIEQRITWYGHVLIHEMIHAIFALYGHCDIWGCTKPYNYVHSDWAHHPSWIEAACAVKTAAWRFKDLPESVNLINLDFWLKQERYMARSMQLGGNLPNDAELTRIGLYIPLILEHRDELRRKKAARENEAEEEDNELRKLYRSRRGGNCLRAHWTVDSEQNTDDLHRISAFSPINTKQRHSALLSENMRQRAPIRACAIPMRAIKVDASHHVLGCHILASLFENCGPDVPIAELNIVSHHPVAIKEEDFVAGGLRLGSYSTEGIAAAVKTNLRRLIAAPTMKQQEGLVRLKYQGSWSLSDVNNIEDFQKFFDIFNAVIYNGALTGHCKLQLLGESDHSHRGVLDLGYCAIDFPGWERDPRFRTGKRVARISIQEQTIGDSDHTVPAIIQSINILHHLMLHAMFELYTCYCSGCQNNLRSAYLYNGHHLEWLDVANTIEQVYMKWKDEDGGNAFANFNLSFQREYTMALSMQRGANLPHERELKRLGLDPGMILKFLKERRDRDMKDHVRFRKRHQVVRANRCIASHWTVEGEAEWLANIPKDFKHTNAGPWLAWEGSGLD